MPQLAPPSEPLSIVCNDIETDVRILDSGSTSSMLQPPRSSMASPTICWMIRVSAAQYKRNMVIFDVTSALNRCTTVCITYRAPHSVRAVSACKTSLFVPPRDGSVAAFPPANSDNQPGFCSPSHLKVDSKFVRANLTPNDHLELPNKTCR